MTGEVAYLGLGLDSGPIERASRALESLIPASQRAETATTALTQTATKTGAALEATSRSATTAAAAFGQIQTASARLGSATSTTDALARGFERVTKAANDAARAAGMVPAAIPVPTAVPVPAPVPQVVPPPAAPPGPGNDNARRGLAAHQKQNLTYQGFDIFAQAGSGASAGIIAVQQGPQILQALMASEGGLKGGLKDLGATAAGLVTPFALATTAVVGFGAAFLLAGKQAGNEWATLEKATQGIGKATGATVTQLDAMARSNAEAGKVSASTSREIVAAYASTGQIALPAMETLTKATAEYARITGQEVPAAATELARMFADPARGADDLASKLGGLDDRTRQLIQTQIEQGDKSAAQMTLADALKASVDANAQSTTGWAAAWNTATAAAGSYWEVAKRIAGIKLGAVPEGAAEQVTRLEGLLKNRGRQMNDPLGFETEDLQKQLVAARKRLTEEGAKAERDAAEARASSASAAAGNVARAVDPNFGRLSQLRKQQSDLKAALDDPLAREKLSDVTQAEQARDAVTRAITSMTDATGKMISQEEMARRQDQLRIESLKAKTEAEKASVAERQKAFSLIGKTILPSDAEGQIGRAGTIARIEAANGAAKGGRSAGEKTDDFDRMLKRTEDQIRRTDEQTASFGKGAGEVARYRTEQELLTAAKRADRDITPELTAQIEQYSTKAGAAATKFEAIRQASQQSFQLQNFAGNSIIDVLDRIGERGTTAAGIIADLAKSFQRAALQAAVMGTGPFAGLFGTAAAPGSGDAGGLVGAAGCAFGQAGGFGEVLA